jgi:UDPglucose--hexose-1-phosphate uridylyltransferase
MINAAKELERLLQFAVKNNLIEELDVIPSRNALMELLQISEPYNGIIEEENISRPTEILDNLLDYSAENGMLTENTITYRDLLDAKIMGILIPRQSELVRTFFKNVNEKGVDKATEHYYALSQASNYIRMDRILKNLYWITSTEYGNLEITINLSKPEKDPKEIAASKLKPQSNYPKCLLCIENVGFAGHINHPARQNHRVIPVKLANEQWYFQYSPYVYYNEHCIVFNGQHIPMRISELTFERLFDFVEQFPHYFIGSNADLPIVGGSILSHDHFQGGRHIFPMEEAPVEVFFQHSEYKDISAGIVKWPMSVVRLSGKNKADLAKFSFELFNLWREYSDEKNEILAYSKNNDGKIPHNTITPIVRRNNKNEFEIDLVLRNNRTSTEHPDGIFHPHKELHHIKKENIGLIEVMGLAVLPARLKEELKVVSDVLSNKIAFEEIESNKEHIANKHIDWINTLFNKHGKNCNNEYANNILENEVGLKFLQVLVDAGVYKRTQEGLKGFSEFMKYAGFIKL